MVDKSVVKDTTKDFFVKKKMEVSLKYSLFKEESKRD